jgi:serine-type D-Ala-D-Ala carboxypeptidase
MTSLLVSVLCLVAGADAPTAPYAKIDEAVQSAIDRKQCPGAVVVVLHQDRVVFQKAYGARVVQEPNPVPLTMNTVFDMASLTKPVATATAIHILIDQGKLKLSDPVAKHWPAFAANGKEAITIEHCLLHTSGLTADNSIADYKGSREEMLQRIADLKLTSPVGEQFRYSDVGFIVLGELVSRVSGMSLNEFTQKQIFTPLRMTDTGYTPGEALKKRTAPTGKRNAQMIVGEVHDPRAFALGGVAGHAGLFSTADDLTRYARMILNGGELDGVRVLSKDGVKRFTEAHKVPGRVTKDDSRPNQRSYGWDVDTGFSSPRGNGFRPSTGFGHTGFTGTSIWFDPASQTAIIILTSRLHPDEKGNVTELRRVVATIVAEAVKSK